MPLFDRDPSVVGAAAIAVLSALLIAAGVAADVSGRWIAVGNAAVALAVILWPVRSSAYKPSSVANAVGQAIADAEQITAVVAVDTADDSNAPHGVNEELR